MTAQAASISRLVLAAVFMFAGALHFIIPAQYEAIMPPWLPWRRGLVLLSGACEIAGGLGLLVPRVRRAAAWGLIALLVAVWPANAQMLVNARATGQPGWEQLLLALRLPLQLVLIAWVYRAALRRPADPNPS